MNAQTALPTATEHWRPRYHFTPRRNWINDPNGLVFFEGEYHLFYQYNPEGKSWGHMSWGHAVSPDLVQWTELPVAMPEREFMIFSGCAVVDWHNTSGLGDGHRPPLVALYTAFHPDTERQAQHLAYSHDNGRSWIDHPGNPVIDREMEHFRDPKVFWHAQSEAWIMVVALSREHKVAIYRSTDLASWQLASEFGPHGWTSGQWECPDLIALPVEGEDRTIWMLKVDVDKDVIGSVNGAQIFFGSFDGRTFAAENPDGQLAEQGADFYAAQSWSDLPAGHDAPVWLAWMSNHQSGHQYPTDPWRGAMTMPRSLSAKRHAGGWQLVQRPVDLPAGLSDMVELRLPDGLPQVLATEVPQLCGQLGFTVDRNSRIVITIGPPDEAFAVITFDGARQSVSIARTARYWDAPAAFAEPMQASWTGDAPAVQVLLDRASIEVFIPSEGVTLTACVFAPEATPTTVERHGGGTIVASRVVAGALHATSPESR